MANVDAALVEQILDIPKRQREANVEHHRQADDLGAGLEVLKRGKFCHDRTLAGALPRLKASLSDKTRRRAYYGQSSIGADSPGLTNAALQAKVCNAQHGQRLTPAPCAARQANAP